MEETVKSSILSAVGNCVHTSSITKLQTVPLSCLLYTFIKISLEVAENANTLCACKHIHAYRQRIDVCVCIHSWVVFSLLLVFPASRVYILPSEHTGVILQ